MRVLPAAPMDGALKECGHSFNSTGRRLDADDVRQASSARFETEGSRIAFAVLQGEQDKPSRQRACARELIDPHTSHFGQAPVTLRPH